MEAKVEVPAVLSDEYSPPPSPLEWSKACAVFVSASSPSSFPVAGGSMSWSTTDSTSSLAYHSWDPSRVAS